MSQLLCERCGRVHIHLYKDKCRTIEQRKNYSISARKSWSNPEIREKRLKNHKSSHKSRNKGICHKGCKNSMFGKVRTYDGRIVDRKTVPVIDVDIVQDFLNNIITINELSQKYGLGYNYIEHLLQRSIDKNILKEKVNLIRKSFIWMDSNVRSKMMKEKWTDSKSVYNSEEYKKKLSDSFKKRVVKNVCFAKFRYHNEFGEKFQSIFELKFANYLRKKGIIYSLQLPINMGEGRHKVSDFYLPNLNLYCEIVGCLASMSDNFMHYNAKFKEKYLLYKKKGINCLFIYPQDFKNLDIVFEDMKKETYLSEIFTSVSGEGLTIGKIYEFVRFEGCNRNCDGCDTAYALERKNKVNLRELLNILKVLWFETRCRAVFLTGGEPTVAPQILDFVKLLKLHNFYVHIQTNGSIFNKELFDLCNFISCDIKTPVFSMESNNEVITNISKNYPSKHEFKAVVKDEKDIIYIKEKIENLELKSSNFILQPYEEKSSWNGVEYSKNINNSLKFITECILSDNFWLDKKVRVLPQFHKLVWGNKRGV